MQEDARISTQRRGGAARQAATKDLEQERTEKTERKNSAKNATFVGIALRRRGEAARQSRNQKIFTKGNEGNEE
jgi:hypothetical protein